LEPWAMQAKVFLLSSLIGEARSRRGVRVCVRACARTPVHAGEWRIFRINCPAVDCR
jgi:hypothetical protein